MKVEDLKVVIKRKKVKNIKIKIGSDLSIQVQAPSWVSERRIHNLIKEKISWIEKAINYYKKETVKISPPELKRKKRAEIKEFIESRINSLNQVYNFSFNRIFVKNHKSRWGSCSSSKNLNFNYRLVSLPLPLADYIIVHELCHLKEMNHSSRFWRLVSKSVPDYQERRKELKKVIY